jgi:hypothetical protein
LGFSTSWRDELMENPKDIAIWLAIVAAFLFVAVITVAPRDVTIALASVQSGRNVQ